MIRVGSIAGLISVQMRWTKVSIVVLQRRQPSASSHRSAVDYVQEKMGGGDQVGDFGIQDRQFR